MPTRGELRLLLNGSYSYVCTLRELCPTRREYVVDLERVPESVSMIVEDSKCSSKAGATPEAKQV